MTRFEIEKRFTDRIEITGRAATVCRMFGLTADRLKTGGIVHKCSLQIQAGDIVYITGPSGAGKSVLLTEMQKQTAPYESINLSDIELPDDRAVVDCIGSNCISALRLLSCAGLNDVFCVLNRPAYLSEGQKWRFRLAAALDKNPQYIFADEFCSNLDRITASVISYNIRKFADRQKTCFILASSHDDILMDLQPDIIVDKELTGETRLIYKTIQQ